MMKINRENLGILLFSGTLILAVVLIIGWTNRLGEAELSGSYEITKGEGTSTNAYIAYCKALNKGDMKEVKRHLAKSMVEQMEQSGMEDTKILEMIQSMAPKEVKIIDEKMENNNAILVATGGFGSQEGTIKMIKENGEWKLLHESWELVKGYPLPLESSPSSGKVDIAAVDIVFVQKGKDNADLKAIVKNNGETTILQAFYSFSVNEAEEYGGLPVYNFKPGEELELDLSHAYSNYYNLYYKYKTDRDIQKPFKLKMVLALDPKDELKEFDEGNNKITKTFYIQN